MTMLSVSGALNAVSSITRTVFYGTVTEKLLKLAKIIFQSSETQSVLLIFKGKIFQY